jgi:hypothetical protein
MRQRCVVPPRSLPTIENELVFHPSFNRYLFHGTITQTGTARVLAGRGRLRGPPRRHSAATAPPTEVAH